MRINADEPVRLECLRSDLKRARGILPARLARDSRLRMASD